MCTNCEHGIIGIFKEKTEPEPLSYIKMLTVEPCSSASLSRWEVCDNMEASLKVPSSHIILFC